MAPRPPAHFVHWLPARPARCSPRHFIAAPSASASTSSSSTRCAPRRLLSTSQTRPRVHLGSKRSLRSADDLADWLAGTRPQKVSLSSANHRASISALARPEQEYQLVDERLTVFVPTCSAPSMLADRSSPRTRTPSSESAKMPRPARSRRITTRCVEPFSRLQQNHADANGFAYSSRKSTTPTRARNPAPRKSLLRSRKPTTSVPAFKDSPNKLSRLLNNILPRTDSLGRQEARRLRPIRLRIPTTRLRLGRLRARDVLVRRRRLRRLLRRWRGWAWRCRHFRVAVRRLWPRWRGRTSTAGRPRRRHRSLDLGPVPAGCQGYHQDDHDQSRRRLPHVPRFRPEGRSPKDDVRLLRRYRNPDVHDPERVSDGVDVRDLWR